MAPDEALYGRPCRSPLCWTEVRESSITGPDLIRDTFEKVTLYDSVFSRLRAGRRAMRMCDVDP